MAEERIQKILARAGLGSRRACEQLILEVLLDRGKAVLPLPAGEGGTVIADGEEDRLHRPGRATRR